MLQALGQTPGQNRLPGQALRQSRGLVRTPGRPEQPGPCGRIHPPQKILPFQPPEHGFHSSRTVKNLQPGPGLGKSLVFQTESIRPDLHQQPNGLGPVDQVEQRPGGQGGQSPHQVHGSPAPQGVQGRQKRPLFGTEIHFSHGPVPRIMVFSFVNAFCACLQGN